MKVFNNNYFRQGYYSNNGLNLMMNLLKFRL